MSRVSLATTGAMGPQWAVAQIGAREHYAIAAELGRRGLLYRMFTDYWSRSEPPFARRSTLLRALGQRRTADVRDDLVRSFNARTIVQHLVRTIARRGSPYADFVAEGEAFARRVAHELRPAAERARLRCFFGYTTGALEVIEALRGTGVVSILDQIDPSLVEEEIVREERRRHPGWEEHVGPIPKSFYERSWEEWRKADIVVVNSRWSRDALVKLGVDEAKLFILPLLYRPPPAVVPKAPGRRLRVVWAGSVTLRKGIHYLAEAAQSLRGAPVEIKIAGSIHVDPRMIARLPQNMEVLGRVTREEMRLVYAWGDVYVLPTLSDGFGITQLEAMAHGLPVITTDRCGDVVQHGRNGLIVPAGSSAALADAIASLCGDPNRLTELSRAAQDRSREMCDVVFPESLAALIRRVDAQAGRRA